VTVDVGAPNRYIEDQDVIERVLAHLRDIEYRPSELALR
jgi:hypothetical protein